MDTIADMLVRINNANHKLKETVDVPLSKVKTEIARVLKEEGFIQNFRVAKEKGHGVIRINLKYTATNGRVIQGVKRVSRSSLKVYRPSTEIPRVQNGLGVAIMSTPKGIMTGHSAKEHKIGGEILAYIW